MDFNIETLAREYINKRYTNASKPEREKYINDWVNKIPTARNVIKDFKERVGDLKGKKVIDVGCGNGGFSIALAEAGANVTSIEVEQGLYDASKAHLKAYGVNPELFLTDGNALPQADETFDYAFSASVLEHTDDPQKYLEEILRVLKKGGMLYLAFPNRLWPKETHTGLWFLTYLPTTILKDLYIKVLKRNPLKDNNLHFYTYFDLVSFIEKINVNGSNFTVLSEEGKSKNPVKVIIRKALSFLGLTHRAFLPHISVILIKV